MCLLIFNVYMVVGAVTLIRSTTYTVALCPDDPCATPAEPINNLGGGYKH